MGKAPKLSKEERLALKKAKKETARLRKTEREIQEKKDFLVRETKTTYLNEKLVKKKWRDIMERMQGSVLYDDFLALRQSNNRSIDIKNHMIKELNLALDETNDQNNMNLQNHVETIDKLLVVYSNRIEEFISWYRDQLVNLGERLNDEKSRIQDHQKSDVGLLNTMLFAMEESRTERLVQAKADTSSKMDELKDKANEAFQSMQTRMEDTLGRYWVELQDVLKAHEAKTAVRRAKVAKLRSEKQEALRIISMQIRQTKQLQECISACREWFLSRDNCEDVKALRLLRNERNEFKSSYCILRDRMKSGSKWDEQQMATLVIQSTISLKSLKSTLKKGERILRLAALCRPMETIEEKLNFPPYEEVEDTSLTQEQDNSLASPDGTGENAKSPSDESQTRTAESGGQTSTMPVPEVLTTGVTISSNSDILNQGDFLEETQQEVEGLEVFWLRAGRAELERRRLCEALVRLREENAVLRDSLRECLGRLATASWNQEHPVVDSRFLKERSSSAISPAPGRLLMRPQVQH